ncbi:ATP-binding protein [Actinomadura adrarensis]|uniref:ATP-binding protein n=1 Tax=Actinomadura adrarensis TaxID=1819600 RepID=A0ABW3CUK4_9ACTN
MIANHEPSSVILARDLVRYALTGWGRKGDLVHDSKLVMSEIVTNAVAAARGQQLRLRCALRDQNVLLECWDPSPGLPSPRDAALTDESGRGLTIIHACAKEAGIGPSATGQGKIVWARLPLTS